MHQLSYPRYTILAAPAVFALVGALASSLKQPLLRYVLPAAAVIYCLQCLPIAYTRAGEHEWKVVGELIRQQNVQPHETLVFYPGTEVIYYHEMLLLAAAHYGPDFPRTVVRLNKPTTAELVKSIPGTTAWLVSGPLDRPVEQVLPGTRVLSTELIDPVIQLTRVALPKK